MKKTRSFLHHSNLENLKVKKKAMQFTLVESIKIILAVVSIGLLIYLAVSLYGIFTKRPQLEQAKATLESLIEKINSLEENKIVKYTLESPKEWYLISYDKEIIDADSNKEMPSQCNGKDCLCLCYADVQIEVNQPLRGMARGGWPDYFYYKNNNGLNGLYQCESRGVCKNVDGVEINKIHNYRVWAGILEKEETSNVNWISLVSVPKEIYLKKQNGKIIISENE